MLLLDCLFWFTVPGSWNVGTFQGKQYILEPDHQNTVTLCTSDPWPSAVPLLNICTIRASLWIKASARYITDKNTILRRETVNTISPLKYEQTLHAYLHHRSCRYTSRCGGEVGCVHVVTVQSQWSTSLTTAGPTTLLNIKQGAPPWSLLRIWDTEAQKRIRRPSPPLPATSCPSLLITAPPSGIAIDFTVIINTKLLNVRW